MATIDIPDLDPRNEDQLVAEAVDALPAEISDRNDASFAVALLEACGAFYAALVYQLNQVPAKLQLQLLEFLNIIPADATTATVVLEFTATGAGATIPAGTIVKTGSGADAIQFATTAQLILGALAVGTVTANAVAAGAAGNVGASTLETLDTPVSGVASVTNDDSASGGADQESLVALIARAPLTIRSGDRAITAEDFELHANAVPAVERVLATGDGSGSVAVTMLADDINERYAADPVNVTDAAIRLAVETDLEARTIPGVVVSALQFAVRLFVLEEVEVELKAGYTTLTVAANIIATMDALVTAIDIIAADGASVASAGWPWGKRLYLNEIISAIDQTAGVERVGSVKFQQSDDYGTAWTVSALLTTYITAGRDGFDDDTLGMLHHDTDFLGGYALTIVEL